MNWLNKTNILSVQLVIWTIVSAQTSFGKGVDISERDSEIKQLKTEMLVAKSEAEAMKQIDKLLARHRGTAMEPNLWLRKAELYVRQSKTDRFFELSRDSETVVSLTPQRVSKASSKLQLQKAVDTYDMIIRKFPNFNDLDVVLFNNAFTRQQLNQDKIAEGMYRDLIRKYPHSELIPDARLALGEMLFERKAFSLALEEFEAIKKYPESRVYPYGLYKAAWTKYNMKDAAGALVELEQVVAFGKKVVSEGLEAKLDLRSEALNDMILFYGEAGKSSNAYEYFYEQAGVELVGPLLLKLSSLYVHHGKHQQHEQVLRDYVKKMPTSKEIPLAYKSLIENYELQRNRKDALTALIELDKVCEKNGSWQKSNSESDLCAETITKTSLVHANKWHRMWMKNSAFPEFADVASSAYEIYFKREPTGEISWENRFAYAELLFKREKYLESSKHYAIVAKEAKQEKLYHDAGYASILSLEKAVNDQWNNENEKTFQELSRIYIERNKNGKFVLDVRFKRAYIAYEKNRYDEAAPELKQIGWVEKNSAYTDKAQNLYLDILNIKKDFAQLREYSSKLLSQKLSDVREKQIRKIYEESSFAEAQVLEERGEYEKAAAAYEVFANKNLMSTLSDKAWWNSIQLYSRLGYLQKTTDMSFQLYKNYPKSTYSKDALLKAAQGYESMAQLNKAAQVLVVLAEQDLAQSNKWYSLAADFYALSDETENARKIYRNMTKSKDQSVSQAAFSKLMLIEEKSGNKNDENKLWHEIVSSGLQPQSSIALAKIADRQFSSNNYSDAFRTASRVIDMGKSGASKSAMAKARFIQASILEKEFISQSVKSRGERLAVVLQIKTEKLDKAAQAYQDSIRYGDGKVSTEALLRMAFCYGSYVDSIRSLELVGEYSKEEIATLRKELENMALPVEDKRADILQEALKLAKKLELRDGKVAEIQKEINKVNLKRTVSGTIQIQLPDIMLPKLSSVTPEQPL